MQCNGQRLQNNPKFRFNNVLRGTEFEGERALLDEQGLLTCMACVNFNPMGTVMADCPENSDFTSTQQRIREYVEQRRSADFPRLKPFSANKKLVLAQLRLVMWT